YVSTSRLPIPPHSPYTTLFRSCSSSDAPTPILRSLPISTDGENSLLRLRGHHRRRRLLDGAQIGRDVAVEVDRQQGSVHRLGREDRKSTRLNSSHVKKSYAVFC